MPSQFITTQKPLNRPAVIIHGLWMNRAVMGLLARRLNQHGLDCHLFGYSTRAPKDQVVAQLADWLEKREITAPHFVGHSLGGLVIGHYLRQHPPKPDQRVVLLASPINGSRVARQLARFAPARWAMGASFNESLAAGLQDWPYPPQTLMIAANRPRGPGRLIPHGLTAENDGTVNLSETQHPRLDQHIQIHTSHLFMVFNRHTAELIAAYL